MTLLTVHFCVKTSKCKSRARVIEARCRFPCILGMTLSAIGGELAVVLIGVAGGAFMTKAEESPVEVFNLKFCLGGRRVLSVVAALALLLSVFTFETKAGLGFVIKGVPN